MGTRVEFWPCLASGPVEGLVKSAPAFRDWYASEYAESCAKVLKLAEDLTQHSSRAFAKCAPETTDRLVAEFYGFFAKDTTLPVPMLNLQHYLHVVDAMEADAPSSEVRKLVAFIPTGRPVAPEDRHTPYLSDDNASWVSWWTHAEVLLLRAELPRHLANRLNHEGLDVIHEALDLAHVSQTGLVITVF